MYDIYVPRCVSSVSTVKPCELLRVKNTRVFQPSLHRDRLFSLHLRVARFISLAEHSHFFRKFLRETVSLQHVVCLFDSTNWRLQRRMCKENCNPSLSPCRREITCHPCSVNERAYWLLKKKIPWFLFLSGFQIAGLLGCLLALLVALYVALVVLSRSN
jgi:hypothetical protein